MAAVGFGLLLLSGGDRMMPGPTLACWSRRLLTVAVACVVLLVAGCVVDQQAQTCHIFTEGEAEAQAEAEALRRPTPAPTPDEEGAPRVTADFADWQAVQVLVAHSEVPAGTTVRSLMEAPTVYLSARALPVSTACPTTISSIAMLTDLDGQESKVVIEAGQYLDTRQFGLPAG